MSPAPADFGADDGFRDVAVDFVFDLLVEDVLVDSVTPIAPSSTAYSCKHLSEKKETLLVLCLNFGVVRVYVTVNPSTHLMNQPES